MTEYYGDEENIKRVMKLSGMIPDQDLNLNDDPEDEEDPKTADEKFEELVEDYFIVAKSYIDNDRNRSFDEDTPPGIVNISERIVLNMLGFINQKQSSPIVQADDFNIQLIEDKILTDAIKADLATFDSGPEDQTGVLGIGISNRNTRLADKEED